MCCNLQDGIAPWTNPFMSVTVQRIELCNWGLAQGLLSGNASHMVDRVGALTGSAASLAAGSLEASSAQLRRRPARNGRFCGSRTVGNAVQAPMIRSAPARLPKTATVSGVLDCPRVAHIVAPPATAMVQWKSFPSLSRPLRHPSSDTFCSPCINCQPALFPHSFLPPTVLVNPAPTPTVAPEDSETYSK